MSKINYSGPMTEIPGQAAAVLLEIMDTADLNSVLITSTTRTPVDQARIMFTNLEKYGAATQKRLYKAPGQEVIDAYISARSIGLPPDQVQAAMIKRIMDFGPQNISRHCAIPTVRSVFDIAPNSVPDEKKPAFEMAVSDHPKVDKFLKPTTDLAYHVEVMLS